MFNRKKNHNVLIKLGAPELPDRFYYHLENREEQGALLLRAEIRHIHGLSHCMVASWTVDHSTYFRNENDFDMFREDLLRLIVNLLRRADASIQ